MKKNGIIIIDPEKCVACKTCELQCAVAHSKFKVLEKAIFEEPLSKPRVKVESIEGEAIPLQCRHCEDAPCIKICPTKAIDRVDQESPVLIKDELCIGCKMCILVCPFGVINMDKKGKAIIKCDLCIERLKKGENPACVQGCPTQALKFMSIEEVVKEKIKKYLVSFKNKDNI